MVQRHPRADRPKGTVQQHRHRKRVGLRHAASAAMQHLTTLTTAAGNSMHTEAHSRWHAAALCLGLAAAAAHAQPQAQLQASRTQCTAPCAIHFDGSGSSPADPADEAFTDLEYLWDFGDAEAGIWTSGSVRAPRRLAVGPLAAHVFERPGSYRVRLQVYAANGSRDLADLDIEVMDPDQVFAGLATTCLARASGGFEGCPAGARQQVGSDARAAFEQFGGPGRRLLLRRGDSFDAVGALRASGQGPGQLGAFGAGPAPRLQQGPGNSCLEFGSSQQATRDFSFFGLRCEKPTATQNDFSTLVQHPVGADLQPVEDILVGRVEASGYAALQGGPILGEPALDRVRRVTLFEVSEDGFTPGSFVINFPFGRQMAWLGVRIDRSSETCISTNSAFRSSTLQDAVISQVEFQSTCTGPLRLHSRVTADPDSQRPRRIVVTRSVIGPINPSGAFGGNGGPVSVEPGVSAAAQIRDYVFEANLVRYGPNNNAGFDWSGRGFVARNNLFDLRGTPSDGDAFAVFAKNGGDHGASARMRFVHNTVFQLQGGPWQAAFANFEGASDLRAFNNALRTAGGSHVGALVGAGFAEVAGNRAAGPADPQPLAAPVPAIGALADFCPRDGGGFDANGSPARAALDVFGRERGPSPSAGFCELSQGLFANGFEAGG